MSTNFITFVCFKKLYPLQLFSNYPFTKNGLVNYLPLPFTHDVPSLSLVNKTYVWYLNVLMSNHPNLLNAFDELHIVTETILIPIFVIERLKKLLHFFFYKISTYFQAFRARLSATQVINICKFLTNDKGFMIKNDLQSFPIQWLTYGNVTPLIFTK